MDSELIRPEDFINPEFGAQLKAILDQANIPIEQFIANLKQMAQQGLGTFNQAMPVTEAELKKLTEQVKAATKGTTDYFTAQNALSNAMKNNKEIVAGTTSAYKAYSIENEKMRQTAKDLAITFGTTSEQAKKATAAFNTHNDVLVSVDNSMGNYTRNVGNYSNAIDKSLNKLSEGSHVLRALGAAFGVELGPIREYVQGIRGAVELIEQHSEKVAEDSQYMAANIEKIANNTAVTQENVVVEGEQVAATEAVIASNIEVGESWLSALGPIGLFVIGIGVVGAALELYVNSIDNAAEHQKLMNTTENGLIAADEKMRDAFNEDIRKIEELCDKYDVLEGKMSDYQAKLNGLSRDYTKTTDEALKAYLKEVDDIGILDNLRYADRTKQLNGDPAETLAEQKRAIAQERYNLAMSAASKEQSVNVDIATKEALNTQIKALNEARKATLENNEEIESAANKSILNNENREKEELATKLKYSKLKNDIDINTIDLTEDLQNPEIQAKRKELVDKNIALNTENHEELKALDIKYGEERMQRVLKGNEDKAKLTGDAFKEENARYDHELYNLQLDLEKGIVTEREYKKELLNLEKTHGENIATIQDKQASEQEAAQKKINENIKDKQTKAFEDQLLIYKEFKRKQAEFIRTHGGTYSGLNTGDKKTYDLQQSAGEGQNKQALQDIDNIGLLQNDANSAAALQEKARHDAAMGLGSVGGAGLKRLTSEQVNAQGSENKEARDKLIASWGMDPNTTDKLLDLSKDQAAKLAQVEQDGIDKINEIKRQGAIKQMEWEKQEREMELAAIDATLKLQNEAVQQNLAAKSALLQDDMQAQATLAGEGRANSMAAIMKAQAQNEAAQQKAARAAAQQQEAIELGKLIINLEEAYVKGGMDGPAALQKALAQALLTKAVVAGFSAAFYDGTPDTGNGGNLDSKGGFLAMLHPKEAVINAEQNAAAPGLSEAWLNEGVVGVQKWVMQETYLPRIKDDISHADQFNTAMTSILANKLDQLNETIKNKHTWEPMEMSRIVKEDGETKKIFYKDYPIQGRKKHPMA